jgi:hypothetical protein
MVYWLLNLPCYEKAFVTFISSLFLAAFEVMAGFIPANETILGLSSDNWQNGSLFPQTQDRLDTAYLGLDSQSNVNLTIYPNNIAGITFPVEGLDIVWTFTLAQSIFDPSNYHIGVYCMYPLSGQYDMLPRGLFYLLLIFSLIFRRHNWLATAALGTAMTYAAVSAVHMLALVTNFDFGTPQSDLPKGWNINSSKGYGDVDVFGIYPILSAAAIMLTPILNWSVSVRANEAQMVVVYWGALVFAALVPAWLYNNNIKEWWINFPVSFVVCPYSAAATHPDCGPSMNITTESFVYCQCADFCGLLGPATPMRKHANMVPSLERTISELANYSRPLQNLYRFDEFVLAVIVAQGILGLIESQFSQAEVRNLVFRVLYAEPRDFIILLFEGERQEKLLKKLGMQNASQKPMTSLRWKLQFHFARLVAAAFFVFAVFFAVLALAVFVTNVITQEIYLTFWPVSERSDAVGAWSIWVGAAFVIIAAIIVRYHASWMKSLVVLFRAFWRVVAWADNERHVRFQSNDPEPEKVRHRVKAFFSEVAIPFVHGWYSTRRAFWTLSYTMQTFAEWFNDPIELSKQTRRKAELIANNVRELSCPDCQCRMCRRHRESGDVEDEGLEKRRQNSSIGERLVGGIHKLYTVKKVSRMKGEDTEGDETESKEMEPMADYDLPQVTATSTFSLPLIVEEGRSTSAVQSRQSYARQNSDTSHTFTVLHKSLRSRSESTHSSEGLLSGNESSEPILGTETLTSEPVDESQDATELQGLRASMISQASTSGYGRLPSR